jgi:hypothetical protein
LGATAGGGATDCFAAGGIVTSDSATGVPAADFFDPFVPRGMVAFAVVF